MFAADHLRFLFAAVIAAGSSVGFADEPAAERSELRATLETEVPKLLQREKVPGVAIGVVRDGKVLWTDGFGLADVESKKPVTRDTVFNAGSISKTVSAWGIMKLVEKKLVDLDAPIEKYLKTWRFPDSEFSSEGVTLRRLLSHTAGLSLHGYPGFTDPSELPSLEESLAGNTNGAGDVRIVYEPGEKRQYSGGGYTVAQLMVEDQSQRAFADYMQEEVLGPLQMSSSHFGWSDSDDTATPYDENGAPIAPLQFTAVAAAGISTTCQDLTAFAAESMKTDPKQPSAVLSGATLKLMHKQVVTLGTVRTSGLGYQQMQHGPYFVLGHLGSNRGWEAAMLLRPESGDGLVMLSNSSNGSKVLREIFVMWAQSLNQ